MGYAKLFEVRKFFYKGSIGSGRSLYLSIRRDCKIPYGNFVNYGIFVFLKLNTPV